MIRESHCFIRDGSSVSVISVRVHCLPAGHYSGMMGGITKMSLCWLVIIVFLLLIDSRFAYFQWSRANHLEYRRSLARERAVRAGFNQGFNTSTSTWYWVLFCAIYWVFWYSSAGTPPAIETFSLETLRVYGHFCGVTPGIHHQAAASQSVEVHRSLYRYR
jgi:hypothetical protein